MLFHSNFMAREGESTQMTNLDFFKIIDPFI